MYVMLADFVTILALNGQSNPLMYNTCCDYSLLVTICDSTHALIGQKPLACLLEHSCMKE